MKTPDKVAAIIATVLMFAMVFAIVRIAIPYLVNTHTDWGLIGAFIAGLTALTLLLTAAFEAAKLLGLTQGNDDEEA